MFASKAGAYSSGAPFKDFTIRVYYQTYPQTLEQAGKACQGQTLHNSLFRLFVKITAVNVFTTLAPDRLMVALILDLKQNFFFSFQKFQRHDEQNAQIRIQRHVQQVWTLFCKSNYFKPETGCCATQHNDTQHYDTEHDTLNNDPKYKSIMTLSMMTLSTMTL